MRAERPSAASALIASGLTKRIPRAIASAPAISSGGFDWSARTRHPAPTTKKMTPSQPARRVGLGRGGRLESASVIGTRATVRAGHQAAPTAVTSARTRTTTTSTHGTLRRSMRWPAAVSSSGESSIQHAAPVSVPATAAIRPTAAPSASITFRTCARVAPMAATMPS